MLDSFAFSTVLLPPTLDGVNSVLSRDSISNTTAVKVIMICIGVEKEGSRHRVFTATSEWDIVSVLYPVKIIHPVVAYFRDARVSQDVIGY